MSVDWGNKSEREAQRPANPAEELGDILQLGENQLALWNPSICNSYWGAWKCLKHSCFLSNLFDSVKAPIQNDLVFATKLSENNESEPSTTVIPSSVC